MALRCDVKRLCEMYEAKYGEPTTMSARDIQATWLALRFSSSDSDEYRDHLTIQVLLRMRHPVTRGGVSKKKKERR